MKIIKDEQNLINLHPLVIYFTLSEEDCKMYEEALYGLNKYVCFTKGLFEFEVVKRTKEYSEDLPKELTDTFKRYNTLVRILDDETGNFYYGLKKINFNKSAGEVELSLLSFIKEVCNADLKQIELQLNALDANETSRKEFLHKLKLTFSKAKEINEYQPKIWAQLTGQEVLVFESSIQNECSLMKSSNSAPQEYIDKWLHKGLSEADIHEMYDDALFSLSKDNSHALAEAIGNKSSDEICIERNSRNIPKKEYKIQIEIAQQPNKTRKNGSASLSWNVKFHIDEKVLCCNSKWNDIYRMLYITTLLRIKNNEHLYVYEFIPKSNLQNARFWCKKKDGKVYLQTYDWMEEVYNKITSQKESFNEWFNRIYYGLRKQSTNKEMEGNTNSQEPLKKQVYQSKSNINRLIKEIIPKECEDVLYYLKIDRYLQKGEQEFYHINVKPEDIIVPEELMYLVDNFYKCIKEDQPNDNKKDIDYTKNIVE